MLLHQPEISVASSTSASVLLAPAGFALPTWSDRLRWTHATGPIPRLLGVSLEQSGEGCVVERVQALTTAHSQARQAHQAHQPRWGGQPQVLVEVLAPCKAMTGPGVPQMASAEGTREFNGTSNL